MSKLELKLKCENAKCTDLRALFVQSPDRTVTSPLYKIINKDMIFIIIYIYM
ncbi:hypothetical protein Hanom_Chr06g00502711 [Helianthus anomalus]